MIRRLLGICLSLVILVGLGWVIASPYLVTLRVEHALDSNDSATVRRHVDFPALRESVKQVVRGPQQTGTAGIVQAVVGAVTDVAVDTLVTEETLSLALDGRGALMDALGQESGQAKETPLSRGYLDANRFGVWLPRSSGKGRVGFIYHRTGVTNWTLREVLLER